MNKEEEYKSLFQSEAQEGYEELNNLLTSLEKKPKDKEKIDAIFRITHTMKGNAAGVGLLDISALAHTIEDLFGVVRDQDVTLTKDAFSAIFKAVDVLGNQISGINNNKAIPYKGIKAKLNVLQRQLAEQSSHKKEKDQNQKDHSNNDSQQSSPSSEVLSNVPRNKADNKRESETNLDTPKITFSDMVQVPVHKLDNLLNLVGELIIERDRIITSSAANQRRNEFSRLNRISSDLQYSVMDVRLVQTGFLFNKFHRVVRDAALSENKAVSLILEGADTEIDRNILQIISDSLIHLIRNAVAHGIENPADRKQKQKAEEGKILLKAYNENDSVIIEIHDDGAGISPDIIKSKALKKQLINQEKAMTLSDQEAMMLIFEPGFSTLDQVNSIAGRGVGMDVVRNAVGSVGGHIMVESEVNQGTIFRLTLPSSMAVKGVLLFEIDHETHAIPLSYTESVISITRDQIFTVGNRLVTHHLGKTISLVQLNQVLQEETGNHVVNKLPEGKLNIIIVSYLGQQVGFIVDRLLQQKEVVEKPLTKPLEALGFVSGATILGTGNVCLILNIPSILQSLFKNQKRSNQQILLTNN